MPWISPVHVRQAVALWMIAVALVACGPAGSSTSAAPRPSGGPTPEPQAVAAGQSVIVQRGCGACHIIPGIAGATGAVGPNLSGVASRSTIAGGALPNNTPGDLKRWILDPPAAKPGTQMPKLGLSDDEASQVVAYLETLK